LDIHLFGDGEELRDHVYVEDVAEIIVRVLLKRSTGVINVASGQVNSFYNVAKMIVDAAKSTSLIFTTPRFGQLPFKGFRPFDISEFARAFPEVKPMLLADWCKQGGIECYR
jgi:nucleoside-diphosphate-sugar epimerase